MRGLVPRITMGPGLSARIHNSAVLTSIGVSDSNHWRPGFRYPTMSALNTQRLLPDSKLESGKEQGPST
jgi:hypothetical protein